MAGSQDLAGRESASFWTGRHASFDFRALKVWSPGNRRRLGKSRTAGIYRAGVSSIASELRN